MILPIFGPHSPLFCAVSQIMERMLQFSQRSFAKINAENLPDVREKWKSIDIRIVQSVFFFSECPSHELATLMRNTGAPTVLILEDFSSIVHFAMTRHGMQFQFATRFATHVICAAALVAETPCLLRLGRGDHKRPLASFVEQMINFFGVSIDASQFASLVDSLATHEGRSLTTLGQYAQTHFPFGDGSPSLASKLDEVEKDCVAQLEKDYGTLIEGGDLDIAIWPLASFSHLEADAFDGHVECVGPARVLFYGPYFHLPPGRWRATIQMEIAECFSDNKIVAEIVFFPDRRMTGIKADLPTAGVFAFDMDFSVDCTMAPIEIRVHLATGAIEGRVRFNAVKIERIPC